MNPYDAWDVGTQLFLSCLIGVLVGLILGGLIGYYIGYNHRVDIEREFATYSIEEEEER